MGSYGEIADLIEEYHDAGVSEFVLSGYPHLEEAYWFGEGCGRSWLGGGCWTRCRCCGRCRGAGGGGAVGGVVGGDTR